MVTRASKLLFALAASAAMATAQSTAPAADPKAADPATTDASAVVLAQKPAPPPPVPLPNRDLEDSDRAISSRTAAALASAMPKYSVPTPTPTPTLDPELDRPKNGIVRLPSYVLRESRPPVFRKQDLYTTQGLIDLSFKSHPGLLFGNILGLNSGVAYQMWLDEQREAALNDFADESHAMDRGGDKAESQYILQASQETFMRPVEPVWNGPGGNGGFSGGSGR
ncbi:MAG TPA: hypothetical protein VGF85_09210 [Opitutaceae bacterium]|jgi:hypothetical protein